MTVLEGEVGGVPQGESPPLTWSLRRNCSRAGLPTDRILLRSRRTRASGRPSEPVVGVMVTSPSPASSKTLRITNRACMWACRARVKGVICSPEIRYIKC